MTDYSFLISKAIEAQSRSYAPYSGYNVGASLLARSGNIYTGCNIENASYGATICAERSAFASAISAGERKFEAIAIVGGRDFSNADCAFPCGICLQVMSEHCDKDFTVIVYKNGKAEPFKLGELLPNGFKL